MNGKKNLRKTNQLGYERSKAVLLPEIAGVRTPSHIRSEAPDNTARSKPVFMLLCFSINLLNDEQGAFLFECPG